MRYRLPAFYEFKDYVEDGGLMSHGPNLFAVLLERENHRLHDHLQQLTSELAYLRGQDAAAAQTGLAPIWWTPRLRGCKGHDAST